MKRFILTLVCLLLLPSAGFGFGFDSGGGISRSAVETMIDDAAGIDASGFDGNLTTSDDTVQEVAQKLDDLSVGGSPTWGSITGTLSNQTDLQSALDGKQAADADLTTYAGITPSANVISLLSAADYAAIKALLDLDDLQTLTGIAAGTAHLGTFTGTTIADNQTIKTALQSLETAVEGVGGGHDPVTIATGISGLTLATQELSLQADLEAIADQSWNPTSTINLSGATVTFGLTLSDLPTTGGTWSAGGVSPTFGTVTATGFVSNAADGAHYGEFTNTVAITATATEGRIAYYNGRMRLADGTDWDGYFLEDTDIGLPASADGNALGSASLEWSDLYLADGGVIYGQNDQSNTVTSGANGWTFSGLLAPSGSNPTTAAAGALSVDTDDHFIEIYTDASRVAVTKYTAQMTIWDPDTIQAIEDAVPLLAVEADWAPHGITIVDCGWKSDAAATQTIGFEEWTSPTDGTPSTIEDVTSGSDVTEQADDGTLADSAVAAGSIVMIDLPTTSLNYLQVWMTYFVNPGD